ncbi:MAG: hypothetical protein WB579_07065 [Bryobacteraceae bacterium]
MVWAAGFLFPLVAFAAEVPTFTASSVLPANAAHQEPLRPLMLVSIYGRHLGPATGCTPPRGAYPEPAELCGVSVSIGGSKARLLYVQDRQINLSVPLTAQAEGMVDFVVTYGGRSSVPVPVRFAPLTARIRLTGPAHVHMPVWIDVELPESQRRCLRYPIRIWPTDLGGNRFEVRRNGVAFPPIKLAHFSKTFEGPGAYGMIGAGNLLGLPHQPKNRTRLPLHLIYRFDRPGLYEVRYAGRDGFDGSGEVLARSGWLKFAVLDFPPSKRASWLAEMRRAAPSDPVELLSDYLPSILALPDSAVLSIVEEYLYNSSDLVRQYAGYSLYAFDERLIAKEIPSLIEGRGPTDELAYVLSWRRYQLQPQRAMLVRSLVKHLDSADPLVSAGSLQALYFLKGGYDWKADPGTPALMDKEVAARADRFIDTRNFTVLQPLALYLGTWKTDQSRNLLWRIVEQGYPAREQALICLTWIGDPRDLPRLGKYNTGSIDYNLNRAYGKAAGPYLKGRP